MMSKIDFLVEYYRELVTPHGARDIPSQLPEKGSHFCPIPTVNRLWAKIQFCLSGSRPTAQLTVYDPGAATDGGDKPYYTIFIRPESAVSSTLITEDVLYPFETDGDTGKFSECSLIQKVFIEKLRKAVNLGLLKR